MQLDINKAQTVIDELKSHFMQKYGFTIFNVSARKINSDQEMILEGNCITQKQLNLLKRKISHIFDPRNVHYNVKALSDLYSSDVAQLWGKAGKSLVDVTSSYDGTKLATQITPEDNYFKIADKEEKKSLILLEDHTLGWVENSDIRIFKKDFSEFWYNLKYPEKGKVVVVKSVPDIFDEACRYVNKVRYLRGGRSADGIDCSAFVQLLYKKVFNLVMPRHTIDQMRYGVRVSKSKIRSGDLVFAKVKDTNIMHVGLAFFDVHKSILHSCLREKMVICEKIDDFFKYYEFAGAKRIVI